MKTSTKTIAVLSALTCILLSTPPPARADDAAPFWKSSRANIAKTKLSPAKVELVTSPDLAHPLTTFKSSDGADAKDFVPSNPLIKPFVKKPTDENYRIIADGFQTDAKPFSDRDYKVIDCPERLKTLTRLQTSMSHKGIVDGRFGIVLSASHPVYLFLALDDRLFATFQEHGAPAWMQEFVPTGESLTTDDPLMKQMNAHFKIFVKKCPAGRIVLGPCCADPIYNGMYFGFFAELGDDALASPKASDVF